MATNNAINNTSNPITSTAITIDPGASGDSYIQFNINGTGKFRIGVDDTDSDAFVISQGSALGTNNTFRISADGECNIPLQPLFIASENDELNVTGDGTVHAVGSVAAMTEVLDVGSDFTPGNGAGTGATFTAPITGLYSLNMPELQYQAPSTGGTTVTRSIITSNRTYQFSNNPTEQLVANFYGPNRFLVMSCAIVADMDSADTATFNITGSGGSKVDDVFFSGTRASICGSLLF